MTRGCKREHVLPQSGRGARRENELKWNRTKRWSRREEYAPPDLMWSASRTSKPSYCHPSSFRPIPFERERGLRDSGSWDCKSETQQSGCFDEAFRQRLVKGFTVLSENDAQVELLMLLLKELREPDVELMERVVYFTDPQLCIELLRETKAKEAEGGQFTLDGHRKTAGGVFLSSIRKRLSPERCRLIWAEQTKQRKLMKRRGRSIVGLTNDLKNWLPKAAAAPLKSITTFGFESDPLSVLTSSFCQHTPASPPGRSFSVSTALHHSSLSRASSTVELMEEGEADESQ